MAERLQTVLSHIASRPQGHSTVLPSPSSAVYTQPHTGDSFKYTLDNPRLTPEQRQFYEENGFLVIKNLVPGNLLERYRNRFEEICQGNVQVPGMLKMRDVAIAKSEFVSGEKAITKIQDFQNDEVLFEYCCLPQVTEYVECFTGSNVMAMHTMLINKPPDPGKKSSRHPMHQDLYYFPFRPADKIVCSWTAMENVNRQNGCLVVIPGSHKGELLAHGYPEWEGGVNKMYHGIKDYDPSLPRVHLEMAPGDTVFFHPILIHGSGMNRTSGFRKSISCHYATGDMQYIDVGSDSVQSVIADEVLELVMRRLKMPKNEIKFTDVWKYKSRLVRSANRST